MSAMQSINTFDSPEELIEACVGSQLLLESALASSPSHLREKLTPAYTDAHNMFMADNFSEALVKYEECKQILWKVISDACIEIQSRCTSDDTTDAVEFRPFCSDRMVFFKDVVGLQACKALLQEIVIQPKRYPHLVLEAPRGVIGVLMFGYPGCGKSLFAQATASEIDAPFYNVQISQLQSKYRGESENLVRRLFTALRSHKTSVLFLDEFDAIAGGREGKDNMITFKNELLVEMSGVNANSQENLIIVLAATNMPQNIDSAFLSRFRYKIFIPLPTGEERMLIIDSYSTRYGIDMDSNTRTLLLRMTDRFSGRDIAGVMESLRHSPIHKVSLATHFKTTTDAFGAVHFEVAQEGDKEAFLGNADDIGWDKISRPLVTQEDIVQAFSKAKRNRKDAGDGMLSFARKYTMEKSVEPPGTEETNNCGAGHILCCLLGR